MADDKPARVAVITGAASGMGAGCARALASGCDQLVLADLNPLEVDDPAIHTMCCDVTRTGDVVALADLASSIGRVEVLVHAAGISPSMGGARQIFEVNAAGTARVLDAFEPVMTSGAIVLFASLAGHLCSPAPAEQLAALLDDPLAPGADEAFAASPEVGGDPASAYLWSKRGVMRTVSRRAAAFAARGVRINSVSPSSIDTPMGRRELETQPGVDALLEMTPIARLGTIQEVVSVVRFLASEDASYVTGTDILVDGGALTALAGPLT